MAWKCDLCGKRPLVGNNVSHANNKTKTRSLPNIQSHRFWVPSLGRFVRLRVSAHGIRIINRQGIERVIARLREEGERF